MQSQSQFDQAVLAEYFSGMEFTDQREKEVFLSYLRGFSILFFDPVVKHIVEIGGGQSTAIFALMADRFDCKVSAIDMNPEAIKNKVRSAEICEKIYDSVRFLNGVSLSRSDLESYYECNLDSIGGVPFSKVIQAAGEFVETSMDGRKVPLVLDALNIPRLDVSLLQTAIASNSKFPQSLLARMSRMSLPIFVSCVPVLSNTGILGRSWRPLWEPDSPRLGLSEMRFYQWDSLYHRMRHRPVGRDR